MLAAKWQAPLTLGSFLHTFPIMFAQEEIPNPLAPPSCCLCYSFFPLQGYVVGFQFAIEWRTKKVVFKNGIFIEKYYSRSVQKKPTTNVNLPWS